MARLVFGMNQSLDGYVDHMAFAPDRTLFRHFIEEVQGQAGSVYGRRMYEVMRYSVVSRTLKSVGPNARLIDWPDRRVSNLPAPRRAWSGQAILRRTRAAAPPADS